MTSMGARTAGRRCLIDSTDGNAGVPARGKTDEMPRRRFLSGIRAAKGRRCVDRAVSYEAPMLARDGMHVTGRLDFHVKCSRVSFAAGACALG